MFIPEDVGNNKPKGAIGDLAKKNFASTLEAEAARAL